jgi:hypothetical protein
MNNCFIVSCNALLLDEEQTKNKILQIFVEDILRVLEETNEILFDQVCEMIKISSNDFLEHVARKISYNVYNNNTVFFILNFDASFFSSDEGDENEEAS